MKEGMNVAEVQAIHEALVILERHNHETAAEILKDVLIDEFDAIAALFRGES